MVIPIVLTEAFKGDALQRRIQLERASTSLTTEADVGGGDTARAAATGTHNMF